MGRGYLYELARCQVSKGTTDGGEENFDTLFSTIDSDAGSSPRCIE